jgi:hypothetical protein
MGQAPLQASWCALTKVADIPRKFSSHLGCRDFCAMLQTEARCHELVCENQQSLHNRGQANEHDQQFKKICQSPVRSKFVDPKSRLPPRQR